MDNKQVRSVSETSNESVIDKPEPLEPRQEDENDEECEKSDLEEHETNANDVPIFMSPEQLEMSLKALKEALKLCNITKENEDRNAEQLDDDYDDDNIDAKDLGQTPKNVMQ